MRRWVQTFCGCHVLLQFHHCHCCLGDLPVWPLGPTMSRHGARTSMHLATRLLILIQMDPKLLMHQSSFQWGVQPAAVTFHISPQATPIHFGVAPHREAILLHNGLWRPLSIHPAVPTSCLLSQVLRYLPPWTLLILQLKHPPCLQWSLPFRLLLPLPSPSRTSHPIWESSRLPTRIAGQMPRKSSAHGCNGHPTGRGHPRS